MNFLLISYNYAPELTGIGKYNAELCSHLVSKGHKVSVITGYPYYPQWKIKQGYHNLWFSSETIDDVKVFRCPIYVPAKPSGLKRVLQDFLFFFTSLIAATWLHIRGHRFNTVFAVAPAMMNGLSALWYRTLHPPTKIIYHIQDLQVDAAKELGIIQNKSLLNLLYAIENAILKKADGVSTITPAMLNKLETRNIPIKKKILFPNWTTIQENSVEHDHDPLLKQLGIPTNKKIILYSGAIGEKQGLDILMDVSELAKSTLPEAVFVVSGDGPYARKLKHLAAQRQLNNIVFIPLQPHQQYLHLLSAATLHLVVQRRSASDLVMPSKLTTILGIGGVAIVSADAHSNLHNLLHYHHIAATVEPENVRLLFQTLSKLLTNQEERIKISHNALSYAHSYLFKEAVINQFICDLVNCG